MRQSGKIDSELLKAGFNTIWMVKNSVNNEVKDFS
jgi:hypothetical protein